VWGDKANGAQAIYLRTKTVSTGTVYYVNDDSDPGDFFTTAFGNDANNGTSSSTPKRTIQAVLDSYTLGPNDVILVDSGVYDGFTVAGNETGARIIGAPSFQSHIGQRVTINASQVVLQGLSPDQGADVNASSVTLYRITSAALVLPDTQ